MKLYSASGQEGEPHRDVLRASSSVAQKKRFSVLAFLKKRTPIISLTGLSIYGVRSLLEKADLDLGTWNVPFNGLIKENGEVVPPPEGIETPADLVGFALSAIALLIAAFYENKRKIKNQQARLQSIAPTSD